MLWELAYNSWSTLVSRICRFIIACFTCFRAHTTETHKYIKVCVADTLSDQRHREVDVFGSSVILKKCGFDLCVASLCISVVWRLFSPCFCFRLFSSGVIQQKHLLTLAMAVEARCSAARSRGWSRDISWAGRKQKSLFYYGLTV